MPSSQPKLVLLDNTVLSNFAHVNRSDLVMALWSSCATTLEAWQEFQNGITVGKLPKNAWRGLSRIELTENERELSNDLAKVLGLGECTCIAVAKHRNGMFVIADRRARQVALEQGVIVTGTLGILFIAVERNRITLKEANQLLIEMIERGYHSPVDDLGSLISE